MPTKRAKLFFFLHKTRWIHLHIKISESFEIQVNILEILRNKQRQNVLTTYPKVVVSCYTLYHSTLSTVWPSQTWYKVHMCLRGYVGIYMHVPLCLFPCALFCSFVRAFTVVENYAHWFQPLLWKKSLKLVCHVKCIDMVYFWAQLHDKSARLHLSQFITPLYPMYCNYNVTTL